MPNNLVIVESPAKAKTIGKILGRGYVVKSSVGHVRDLPERSLGVDVENRFEPKYVIMRGKQKVIDELQRAADACESIYLAPDPDREGEAIAWHLQSILGEGKPKRQFYRVQYNEITPQAVRDAFEHPGEIDLNRVDAQQARRVLDRIVGYMVSPMLWRHLTRGLSAGRVQSVALRLVCEREKEIQNFVPEEYWILGATVRKQSPPLDPFDVRLVRIGGEKAHVPNQEAAERIRLDLQDRTLRVSSVRTREVTRKAPPPFITSTLQQAASGAFGFAPKRTMAIAQRLYEGVELGEGPVGLITYMRTDSVNVAQDALNACRDLIRRAYGDAFCPPKPNFFRSRRSAQEAHEAIRPTDVTRMPRDLEGRLEPADLKLYTLIWKRFVASQMAPAQIEQHIAEVESAPPPGSEAVYTFRASSSELKFPGYMEVAGTELRRKKKADEESASGDEEVDQLPPLTEGEPLDCLKWLSERKETQPPPRYTEASLIRALEGNGVGRPSTYAQIIATLHQRDYVTAEKRTLSPTELGMKVSDLLTSSLNELFDVKFTASMEELLDEVEEGSVEWTDMLDKFYARFQKWMEDIAVPTADGEHVRAALGMLGQVREWAPPMKRGRRTYSDERFVESIRKQLETGSRPVTQKQLETLMRMAVRYRSQIPDIEPALARLGGEELLSSPELQPPLDTTRRKLELLRGLELDERSTEFVQSLQSQAEGGRRLSEAQLRALNNVVIANAENIPDFERIKDELALGQQAENAHDEESGPLLEALKTVEEWRPSSKRGKRVFDDKAFFESLSSQFERKKFLTPKQRAALRRMVMRYREQIPGYAELAERFELRSSRKPKADKSPAAEQDK